MKFNARITLAILTVLTLVGALYMAVGVLDMSPTRESTRLTLMLNTSGGLLPTSEVTMRGVRIGRVTGIRTTPSGLAVSIDLDRKHPVPANSPISVENLSAAGEQYIDFKPKLIAPPYFTDGEVIPADRVSSTATGTEMLTKADALMSALDVDRVRGIITSVSAAFAGNDETLDSLATTVGLTAKVIADDKQLMATLFNNIATFTTNLDELHAGEVIDQFGTLLPRSVPAFLKLIREIETLSHTGVGVMGPGDPVGLLVVKVGEYLDMLAGPFSTFTTVLQPATAPLHDIKLDAGHWLDFWESTLSDTGGVRVKLNVPEWHR